MPASQTALDFLDFCAAQKDPRRIAERFVSVLDGLGFEHVACVSHVDPLSPRPGAVSVVTYPKTWLEHYSQADFARIDPVFLAARQATAPFGWRDHLRTLKLSPKQKSVLAEGALYGIRNGLTIPLRSSDMIPASCSLIASRDGVDPLSMAHVLMIVIYAHSALQRRLNVVSAKPIVLSARERDCLLLAGRGKSDWAIGKVLGVAARTAHNTLERTKRRYGVSHRVQAVVRAVFDGQIFIDDLGG
jgi:LuxR family quorum-sensing system transcriptional regulator CciR